jgi:hypothetical protein
MRFSTQKQQPISYSRGSRGVNDIGTPFLGTYSHGFGHGYGPMPGIFGGGLGSFYNTPTPMNPALASAMGQYSPYNIPGYHQAFTGFKPPSESEGEGSEAAKKIKAPNPYVEYQGYALNSGEIPVVGAYPNYAAMADPVGKEGSEAASEAKKNGSDALHLEST